MKPFSSLHIGLLGLALANMIPVVEADDSWWILGVASGAAAASLALTRRAGGSFVPPWLVVLGVLGALAFSVWEMMTPQTIYILDLARFIILLACCKFFELNSYRDAALVALIAFLLLVIGAFVSASPTYGLVLLIDLTFGVTWLLKFQMHREQAAVRARQVSALAFLPAPPTRPVEENDAMVPNWRPTISLAVYLAVICGAIFVSVPRGWGRGLFGRIQQVMPLAVTGLADEIQLRDATILPDQTLVLRATFSLAGLPYGGDDFFPYLRAVTFDRYQENRWLPTKPRILSEVSPARDGRTVMLPHLPSPIRGDLVIEQDLWLESIPRGRLVSLYPPLSVGTKDLRRVQQSLGDLTLQTADPARGPVSYHVASLVPNAPALAGAPDAPLRTRWASGFSTIHPAVRAYTREIFAPEGEWHDPENHFNLARRICDFLRSDEFTYSLSRGEGDPETDRVKEFLFDRSIGHCEYFASTMAVMCQSLNIPARVVSGYYGGEYNNVGNFYQFRASDAHAWVEVWTHRRGWVTFDPSPPSRQRLVNREESTWTRVQRLLDYVRFKWATAIVSFDAASRRELFESFEDWLRVMVEIRHRPRSVGEGVTVLLWGPDMLPFWKRVAYWMLLILFVVFVALVLRLLWILSLMVREWWLGAQRVGLVRRPAARFYDRLLLLLANKGHVRPRHQTPREFAGELAAAVPELKDLPTITEWYYEAQYGDGRLDAARWERVKSLLSNLREDANFGTMP